MSEPNRLPPPSEDEKASDCRVPPPPTDDQKESDCRVPPPPTDDQKESDCRVRPPPTDDQKESDCRVPPPPPTDDHKESDCRVPPPPTDEDDEVEYGPLLPSTALLQSFADADRAEAEEAKADAENERLGQEYIGRFFESTLIKSAVTKSAQASGSQLLRPQDVPGWQNSLIDLSGIPATPKARRSAAIRMWCHSVDTYDLHKDWITRCRGNGILWNDNMAVDALIGVHTQNSLSCLRRACLPYRERIQPVTERQHRATLFRQTNDGLRRQCKKRGIKMAEEYFWLGLFCTERSQGDAAILWAQRVRDWTHVRTSAYCRDGLTCEFALDPSHNTGPTPPGLLSPTLIDLTRSFRVPSTMVEWKWVEQLVTQDVRPGVIGWISETMIQWVHTHCGFPAPLWSIILSFLLPSLRLEWALQSYSMDPLSWHSIARRAECSWKLSSMTDDEDESLVYLREATICWVAAAYCGDYWIVYLMTRIQPNLREPKEFSQWAAFVELYSERTFLHDPDLHGQMEPLFLISRHDYE